MRNHLNTHTSRIPEVIYAADGQLDGEPVDLTAWNDAHVILATGLARFTLRREAVRELATHLLAALATLDNNEARKGADQ